MTLVAWPSTTVLPLPTLAGHGIDEQTAFVRSDMDNGFARQRKRFSKVPSSMKATLLLTQDQARYFEFFFRHKIDQGTDWFEMPVLIGAGLETHEIRFTESPSFKMNSNLFEYSLSLELRQKIVDPVPPADQLSLIDTVGFAGAQNYMDKLNQLVNVFLPIGL